MVRGVALIRVADAFRLSVTLPPGELAAVGLMPVLTVASALVGVIFRIRFMSIPLVLVRGVAAAVVVGNLLIGVTTGADVAETVVLTCLVAMGLWLGDREARRPLRGPTLAVALVTMYALASVAYGLSGRLGPSYQITSADAAVLPSGAYLRVGEDADWIFLAPCTGHGQVFEVPKNEVALISTLPIPDHGTDVAESDPYRFCP